jgi:amino acid adenylation domain-containing protein
VKSSAAAVLQPSPAAVASQRANPIVLLTALAALLHRYSGEGSIGIRVEADSRSKLLPIRVSGDETFEELLENVRSVALDHQADLADARFIPSPELQNELAQSTFCPDSNDESPALAIHLASDGARFVGRTAHIQHLENLLRSASQNPATRISHLTILSEQERQQILFDWNATAQPCPPGCIHELFQKQAEETPQAIALIDGGQRITYSELNQQANRLAHHLLERGAGAEVLVGICMEQSWRMVAGVMAILKTGGAYVPLDPNYPPLRLEEMVRDARLSLVVSNARCRDRVPAGVEIVSVDRDARLIDACSSTAPPSGTTPDSAAYVLYTSGSTGKPKAVVGIHRSVINGMLSVEYSPDEICCLNAFLSFGISIANLFLPLLSGIPLVIVSDEDLRDINGLVNVLEREKITRIVLVPPVFKRILDLGPKTVSKLRSIREVGLAGAALTPDIIKRFTEAMPLAKLHNCYSSSEIGTLATMWNVTPESVLRRETFIGRPVANTRMYVLDRAMNPVPVGVAGEIYVGAPHLARGYLHHPDLTAQRFLPDPFSATPGARLYRTGDLARYLPSGDLEYLGRADDQVKIRGFRIELAEIEAALGSHPAIAQAVVVPRDSQDTSLAAYIVCKGDSPVSSLELRRFLADRLPDFMIPASFTPIESVPLLGSGKVNRIALPEPSGPALGDTPAVAPANATEAWLLETWEAVLGVSGIGVCDSFFDLGGNSLQAAAVVSKIEERMNIKAPAAVFLKECTIRQFADRLNRWDRYPEGIVPIQGGSHAPLYVIHPQMKMRLALEKLGSDHSIVGVQIPLIQSPGLKPMAAEVARRIREYQPNPPYCLAGWCASGNLAFEVAQQLRAAGSPVAVVILLESFNFARMRHFRHWYERALWHLSRLRAMPASDRGAYVQQKLDRAFRHARWRVRFAKYRRGLKAGIQPGVPLDEDEALNRDSFNYVPVEYPGDVVLFRPEIQRHGLSHDPSLGWDGVVPQLEIIDVPGDHVTMFAPPNVDVLAPKLGELLRRYSERGGR